MFRYLCPAAISKTHSCPHFLMKPLFVMLTVISFLQTSLNHKKETDIS